MNANLNGAPVKKQVGKMPRAQYAQIQNWRERFFLLAKGHVNDPRLWVSSDDVLRLSRPVAQIETLVAKMRLGTLSRQIVNTELRKRIVTDGFDLADSFIASVTSAVQALAPFIQKRGRPSYPLKLAIYCLGVLEVVKGDREQLGNLRTFLEKGGALDRFLWEGFPEERLRQRIFDRTTSLEESSRCLLPYPQMRESPTWGARMRQDLQRSMIGKKPINGGAWMELRNVLETASVRLALSNDRDFSLFCGLSRFQDQPLSLEAIIEFCRTLPIPETEDAGQQTY